MSRSRGINPINNIEEALLNPGGDELHTHTERENIVIHNANQIHISPVEASVTQKITNIIKGYYRSPNGVYPLTEFYYYVSETSLEIYDRMGAHLIDVGIGSFTMNEIGWILSNLPQYIKGNHFADPSQVHLDFCVLRNEGWMVFRRSGTFNSLIGYIRRRLTHVNADDEVEYYFDDRADTNIISPYERELIEKFINNTVPIIGVTNISVDYESLKLLIGEHQDITVMVYPANAEDLTYSYEITEEGIINYNEEHSRITGIEEGLTYITFTSNMNPEVQTGINIEVIEYDQLYNDTYTIVRETDIYDIDESYIIGMDEGTTIEQFILTFRNRESNLVFETKDGEQLMPDNYWQWLTTGMTVSLYANGSFYEQLRIIVRGDIDGNGTVNEYDKQCIRRHVNGTEILDGYNFIAADVDKNGTVNLDDLNMIDQYLRGEIPSLN